MQFIIMLFFLLVWLLVLWTGSILLERTGLDRNKARFQSLSALTGTGFTTTEAESIVNHPKRRKITVWLIFIGNTGLLSFIILMILYLRTGLASPTAGQIGLVFGIIIAIFIMIKLRVIDVITDGILRLTGSRKAKVSKEELLYQHDNYVISRVLVEGEDIKPDFRVGDTHLQERDINILAIERGTEVIPYPESEEVLYKGDYLLCYGRVTDTGDVI